MAEANINQTATTQTPEPRCYLLELPPELRLHIYEHVFPTFEPYRQTLSGHYFTEPPLMRTCKMIRTESASGFNKYLSSIMDEKQSVLKVAKAEAVQREVNIDRHSDSDYLNWHEAIERCNELKMEISLYDRFISFERSKLRKEGFRV